MTDSRGRPCIEAKTTVDLEQTLNMTGGNIFHGALAWPFAEDADPLDSPARGGVWRPTMSGSCCCGSGAHRGGAVSGSAGTTAMAVLASVR